MRAFSWFVFMLLILASVATAVPTRLAVHVISKGGKFVGTSLGGALVTIRDADTGELMARGVTAGSTGDTAKIMRDPRPHHAPISTEGTAVFEATLDIDEPCRMEITAYGPLAQRQSANSASTTQWVVPGKHVTGGDGILLELRGFVVDVLEPPTHVYLRGAPQKVNIRANVMMMCGCHITPGGLWDADALEMSVLLERDGKLIGTHPLQYADMPSHFEAHITADQPGAYQATVYVYNPATGNTGVDHTTFVVTGSN